MHPILINKPDSHIFGVTEAAFQRGMIGICGSRKVTKHIEVDTEYLFLESDPEYLICTVRRSVSGLLVFFEHKRDADWFCDGLS